MATLCFSVQNARSPDRAKTSLSELLSYDDDLLDAAAVEFLLQHQLWVHTVEEDHRLFLSNYACYHFPIVVPDVGPVLGIALSLTPRTVLCAMRKEFDVPEDGLLMPAIVNYAAVGASKLVLPAETVKAHGPDKIPAQLHELRSATEAHRERVWAAIAAREAESKARGVRPKVTAAGYVIPTRRFLRSRP